MVSLKLGVTQKSLFKPLCGENSYERIWLSNVNVITRQKDIVILIDGILKEDTPEVDDDAAGGVVDVAEDVVVVDSQHPMPQSIDHLSHEFHGHASASSGVFC